MLSHFANTFLQNESIQCSLEQAEDIGICANANNTEFLCFKQEGSISTIKAASLKSQRSS